jgi:hypothetical protein
LGISFLLPEYIIPVPIQMLAWLVLIPMLGLISVASAYQYPPYLIRVN